MEKQTYVLDLFTAQMEAVARRVLGRAQMLGWFRPELQTDSIDELLDQLLFGRSFEPMAAFADVLLKPEEDRKLPNVRCPECGGPMVKRLNRSTGEVFAGCLAWPRCTGNRSLPWAIQNTD